MAQQPYQQRPPQYQQPYPPQQYPQQQYGQQYPQQGGPGGYIRPKTNTAAWILGIMCVVFFVGFIVMMIMFLGSNPQAQKEVVRANDLDAKLATANARVTQMERTISQRPAVVSNTELQNRLASVQSERDKYWKLLSTEKQHEIRKEGDLHIDDGTRIEGGQLLSDGTKSGCVAHVVLSNTSGKEMRNVEVRLWFKEPGSKIVVFKQDGLVPSLPANTVSRDFTFPINSPIRREWNFDPDASSGGTPKTNIVE